MYGALNSNKCGSMEKCYWYWRLGSFGMGHLLIEARLKLFACIFRENCTIKVKQALGMNQTKQNLSKRVFFSEEYDFYYVYYILLIVKKCFLE